MPFWVCGWWLAVTYCRVSLQHSASMARVLAEARPPGEEEPVPTLRLFRQAEQLCQHEHLLRQQHTRECPCQLAWTGLRRIWMPPPSAGSYSKKRSWGSLRWGWGWLICHKRTHREALDILKLRQDSWAQNGLDRVHRFCEIAFLCHWGGRCLPSPLFLWLICYGMRLCDARLIWKSASILGLERERLKGNIEGDHRLKWLIRVGCAHG